MAKYSKNLWKSTRSSTNRTATLTSFLTPEFVRFPASLARCSRLCLQTWHLPLMVIMPDELGNVLQDCHRCLYTCFGLIHHALIGGCFSECLTLTALTIKSAGPFYNYRFIIPRSSTAIDPSFLLNRRSGQKEEDILTNGLGFGVVFVDLWPCLELSLNHTRTTALSSGSIYSTLNW